MIDTLEFFRRILPRQGIFVLAVFRPGKPPQHVFCPSHEIAAAAALKLDAKGLTVYHACASFKTKDNRTQANAAFMRSFWVDADVDPSNPNKYPTLKAAIVDIGRVCKELQLPLPLIVKSGNGCHAYWTLEGDVEAQRWCDLSAQFKATLEHLAFRQDRTRTADASSVLRPVGTTWRKEGVRHVSAVSAGAGVNCDEFAARLRDYVGRNNVHVSVVSQAVGNVPDENDDLIGPPPEYPDSSADRIIQFCPSLAHVAAQRGVVEEPLWRAMLGVVKYTTEGVQRCHEWSTGHAGYSEAETQEKIDRWVHGPTTCDHFRGTNDNRCTGCERKCTSPIQLGYTEEAAAPAITPAAATDTLGLVGTEEPQTVPHWPKRAFRWDGAQLSRALPDAEGQINWIPFCDTLFYPTMRLRHEDGTWSLQCTQIKRNQRRDEFALPTSLIGEPNKLAAHLASQEIVLTGTQGKNHGATFASEYLAELQRAGLEQATYSKLGWADKHKSFILGNRRITATGEDVIIPGDMIKSARWDADLGCEGTVEGWAELIDLLYNRKGAEPFQFAIGAGFAAPLVEIAELDNWHGIPIAFTGEGGSGKTTTSLVACSMYGRRKEFLRSCSEQGATFNAMVARIGIARNLPMVFDEVTKREADDVASFLYALSNGRPKERLTATGTLINPGLEWNTISFVTSNDNITEFLASTKNRNMSEATQVRVFEIPIDKKVLDIWNDVNALELIEHKLIGEHGVVGREWLRYIITHRVELRDEIRDFRAKYNADVAEGTKERYFRDLIVTVAVAVKHATKLGFVKFDLVQMLKWARGHVAELRRARHTHQYTPEELVSHFLMSLHGQLLVTMHYRDGRGNPETPLEPLRGAPLARMALADKVFFVTTKAINDYCMEKKLQPSWLVEHMNVLGYVVHRQGDGPNGVRKERMCRGTHLPASPLAVFELDYSKVFGVMGGTPDNVVPLPVKEAQKEKTSGTSEG